MQGVEACVYPPESTCMMGAPASSDACHTISSRATTPAWLTRSPPSGSPAARRSSGAGQCGVVGRS